MTAAASYDTKPAFRNKGPPRGLCQSEAIALVGECEHACMENSQLPVDILHWILALLPIVVLLVLLVLLRWTAPQAGPMGMFAAAAVALFAFATPCWTVAVASAKGVCPAYKDEVDPGPAAESFVKRRTERS